MKGKKMSKRILSLVLVLTMLLAYAVPTHAAETNNARLEQVSNGTAFANKTDRKDDGNNEPQYGSNDVVRVSIVLNGKSTLEQGYSTVDIAKNSAAMNYRQNLKATQDSTTQRISSALGERLDVVWNMTLVANIISANVEYGQIEKIKAVQGVKDVVIETRYEPTTAVAGDKPNMAISTGMTSASAAWQAGYTGAGSRIAIIDTGLDTSHQSFNNDAFKHALEEDAARAGMSYDAYVAEKDLLDAAEIEGVLSQLNASKRYSGLTAADLFRSEKIAYGFNYVDKDLDVTHLKDAQGEHGSHVAGIATANRYLSDGNGGFVSAMDAVHVTGNAPDAQILVMKVFGKGGGAYDSDYVVAIEDAIVLGCDSVNLSLGSGSAGFTTSPNYQSIFDNLENSDTVVVISAGNNYAFGQNSPVVYPYSDDVNFHTGGSPGTYQNAFTVASVDNMGQISNYFEVSGVKYLFSETSYTNKPIASLAGDADMVTLDYVFVDGFGEATDYEGIDIAGKVVFCSRGTTSFYQKAQVGNDLGAAATVICNNQPGTINMDLSDYTGTAPAISIMQKDAAAIKAASTPATTADGKTYYTGKITIAADVDIVEMPSDYFTMSDFSSWGVPGDLTLKPEITAPGGNILSLNGTTGTTGGSDKYELMSGTSMAAPQITGLTALLKQYIEENNLGQSGITDRALAQSLLMSTAVPMIGSSNGTPYIIPVLQQGAGLANINNAIGAATYVLVNGNTDGKVKAELLDDPEKTGKYSFKFTLNNLTGEVQSYALDADVFTQAFISDASGDRLSHSTALLGKNVTFMVNGKPVAIPQNLNNFDFDNDGDTDEADAQLLMDNIIKGTALVANQDHTDVDGDGDTDTHDVYALLELLGGMFVNVPANGSVEVTVDISLSDNDKAILNQMAPNGAYVEAYVYAEAQPNAEGAVTASHSIPVLGFYGDWTAASMFDKGTKVDWKYKTESRMPYFYNENGLNGNFLTVMYADGEYYYTGNLYGTDDAHIPERSALNNQIGDVIKTAGYALIRNAGAGRLTVTNAETGEVYYEGSIGQAGRTAGYFRAQDNAHVNTHNELDLSWGGTDASGNALPEGTTVEVKLTMAPEYYVAKDGTVNWDALGEGASMSMPFTIDNTAPEILGADGDKIRFVDGNISFQAKDNRHIAFIGVFDADGNVVAEALPNQTTVGETYTFTTTTALADGVYTVEMYDYACNMAQYRLFVNMDETNTVEGVEVAPTSLNLFVGNSEKLAAEVMPLNVSDRSVVWTSSDTNIATVDENGVVTAVSAGECVVTATSKLDSNFSASCAVTVESLPYTLNGALQDEEGNAMSFQWNLLTDRKWSKVADFTDLTPVGMGSIALASNGNYYVMDAADTWDTHEVNPATGEVVSTGANGQIPYWDMVTSRVFTNAGKDLIYGVYGSYLFALEDPMAPTAYGYNLAAALGQYTGASALVGIASMGDVDGAEWLYALDDAGYIWILEYTGSTLNLVNFYATDLSLKYSMAGDYTQCSLVESSDGSVLFFSHYDGTTNVMYLLRLFQLTSGDLAFFNDRLGDVGNSVWPALLASADANMPATLLADGASTLVENCMNSEPLAVLSETEKAEVVAEDVVDAAEGSLNTTVRTGDTVAPASVGDIKADENGAKTMVVELTAQDASGDIASNNGKITAAYDVEGLTLVGVMSSSTVHSYTDANGVVTVGYADLDTYAAGETVATLVFEVKDVAKSDVTVTNEEVNNDHVAATEELTHTYEAVVTAPTCTEKGYTTYTCTDPECGFSYVGDYVDALGHDYEDVVTPPTGTEKGYTTHTCKRCGHSYVDSYVDALGYDFTKETQNQTITEGSSLTGQITGPADKVTAVYVNGVLVDPKYYTVEGDPATIVLSKEYLENLEPGTYTLRVELTDGAAETTFTLKADSGNVSTGDTFQAPLMFALLALSAAAVCVLTANRKKLFDR